MHGYFLADAVTFRVVIIGMTFWAIGKIKSIGKLGIPQNVKNIGSKLASLVVSREATNEEQEKAPQEEMLFQNDRDTYAKMPPM